MRPAHEPNTSWHGQINRTIWEINQALQKTPESPRLRRELLRAQFLQHFEFDKANHIPRDDRTFLFLHDSEAPIVLLLHGSTGTPAEMRELGNHLHSNGISAYCPRLTRIDSKERQMTWESWVTQAQIAAEIVATCTPNAFVCGLSLGGTVSLILSEQVKLGGLVLLAPALYPRMGLKERLLQMTRVVTPTVFYHFAGWNGEVVKAMDHVRKRARDLDLPLLAVQAEDDARLSPRGLKFLRRHARHTDTDIRLVKEGTHVLTRGAARDEVFDAVTKFITRNATAVLAVAPAPVMEVMDTGEDEGSTTDPS